MASIEQVVKVCKKCGANTTTKWYSGPLCKNCYQNERYSLNKEKILKQKSEYYSQNKEREQLRQSKWRKNNREYAKNKSKLYYRENKQKILEEKKDYYKDNKTHICDRIKSNYLKNKNTINKTRLKRHHVRVKIDMSYKLAKNIRTRIRNALKKGHKPGSAIKDLECTVQELKLYLESKFLPGMSWDNYSLHGWHIDHIVPLSSFNLEDPEQLKKACHYTNLQPLWAKDNLTKGASHK